MEEANLFASIFLYTFIKTPTTSYCHFYIYNQLHLQSIPYISYIFATGKSYIQLIFISSLKFYIIFFAQNIFIKSIDFSYQMPLFNDSKSFNISRLAFTLCKNFYRLVCSFKGLLYMCSIPKSFKNSALDLINFKLFIQFNIRQYLD